MTEIAPAEAPAIAAAPATEATSEAPIRPDGRQDELSFTLAPGQGAEVKLVMRQGAI
ncbi:hypothetical protein X743_31970 [Mesorhizobium sp. LNHC252B00]|nr:hypothetical protein X743_31970 [Mesorhizobium sp. LNHC252B00]